MKRLKLMVKETKEVRRNFTEDEKFIFDIANGRTEASMSVRDRCLKYLNDKGFVDFSSTPFGATFRTDTLREATPEEILAYHTIEIYETSCFKIKGTFCKSGKCPLKSNNNNLCIMCSETRDKARQLLACKEIYPEVVEE